MSASKLKLYATNMSQPCRAIAILLKLNSVPFEEQTVSFVTGETRAEWFSKVNPMRRVPAMQDGDFLLTESVAILKYLAAARSLPDHWYPKDVHQRARVDEFIAWQHTGIRRHGAMVFIGQGLRPHKTGQPVDLEQQKKDCQDLERILEQMENYFLGRSDFIGGDDVTLADLLAICEMMQAACVGYPLDRNRPRMKKWMERVKARLQPHFDEVHKEIFAFGAQYYKNDF